MEDNKRLCATCDVWYSHDEAWKHAHFEPQSGKPREDWLASKLTYQRWIFDTVEGAQWWGKTASTKHKAYIDKLSKADNKNETWLSMSIAPKENGKQILLMFENERYSVGYWDITETGGFAWVEPCSGEKLHLHYDHPIGWKPL